MKHLSREEIEARAAIPPTPEELELIRQRKEARSKLLNGPPEALWAFLDPPDEYAAQCRTKEWHEKRVQELQNEDPEITRKRKEIRSKIFAEAIANNEMVDVVIERYRKERKMEAEVRN